MKEMPASSRNEVLKIARYMGCRGAHKFDGKWMPCADHATLLRISNAAEKSLEASTFERKKRRKRGSKTPSGWEQLGERGVLSIGGLSGGGIVSGKAKSGPCWPGYVMQGMKPGKKGRMVPNCVPVEEKGERYVRPGDTDVFSSAESARSRAKQMGCIGIRRYSTVDGTPAWMPCTNESDYRRRLGTSPQGRRDIAKRQVTELRRTMRRLGQEKKSVLLSKAGTASTPAPKKDQIIGSKRNRKGSAASRSSASSIDLSKQVISSLKGSVKRHNSRMEELGKPEWSRADLDQLKAVWRRGAGAFSVSHRPGMTRSQWAFARVRAFLWMLEKGRPKKLSYITDTDLLRDAHPFKKRRSSKSAVSDIFQDAIQVKAQFVRRPRRAIRGALNAPSKLRRPKTTRDGDGDGYRVNPLTGRDEIPVVNKPTNNVGRGTRQIARNPKRSAAARLIESDQLSPTEISQLTGLSERTITQMLNSGRAKPRKDVTKRLLSTALYEEAWDKSVDDALAVVAKRFNKNIKEIQELIGSDINALRFMPNQNFSRSNTGYRLRLARARKLLRDGVEFEQIQDELNVSRSTLRNNYMNMLDNEEQMYRFLMQDFPFKPEPRSPRRDRPAAAPLEGRPEDMRRISLDKRVQFLLQRGMKPEEIGPMLGRTPKQIQAVIDRLGPRATAQTSSVIGTRNHGIDETTADMILTRWLKGESPRQLASRFNVTTPQIQSLFAELNRIGVITEDDVIRRAASLGKSIDFDAIFSKTELEQQDQYEQKALIGGRLARRFGSSRRLLNKPEFDGDGDGFITNPATGRDDLPAPTASRGNRRPNWMDPNRMTPPTFEQMSGETPRGRRPSAGDGGSKPPRLPKPATPPEEPKYPKKIMVDAAEEVYERDEQAMKIGDTWVAGISRSRIKPVPDGLDLSLRQWNGLSQRTQEILEDMVSDPEIRDEMKKKSRADWEQAIRGLTQPQRRLMEYSLKNRLSDEFDESDMMNYILELDNLNLNDEDEEARQLIGSAFFGSSAGRDDEFDDLVKAQLAKYRHRRERQKANPSHGLEWAPRLEDDELYEVADAATISTIRAIDRAIKEMQLARDTQLPNDLFERIAMSNIRKFLPGIATDDDAAMILDMIAFRLGYPTHYMKWVADDVVPEQELELLMTGQLAKAIEELESLDPESPELWPSWVRGTTIEPDVAKDVPDPSNDPDYRPYRRQGPTY